MFPTLCVPTAPVVVDGARAGTGVTAGLTMPRRAVTRSQGRRDRVDEERRLNELQAELRRRDPQDLPTPPWGFVAATGPEPPPPF
jgi:hypothetical protein